MRLRGTGARARTGHEIRPADGGPLPPDIRIEDGLTQDEAVAIALWNSPAFQLTLADLGLARADLVEAGLLRNPVLSLLFPWGPKQLEWTLQFPLDALWQRPRRVAAARLNLESVSQRLVWDALTLVAEARSKHADAVIAEQRLALAIENFELATRIAKIANARLAAGDISDLEARGARNDASRTEVSRQSAEHDRDLALVSLAALLGLDTPAAQLLPTASAAVGPPMCGPDDALLTDALAARPDIRAAEIAIEAAGARARWESSRVFTLIGIIDANGGGNDGAEIGPGLAGEIPIFSRNQGGIGRAEAELTRASRRYAALRAQVALDVRSSAIRLRQANAAIDAWRVKIVPSLEVERRQAESAFRAGEVPLLNVLDVSRRLVDARMRQLDADAALQQALVALEHSVGHSCSFTP